MTFEVFQKNLWKDGKGKVAYALLPVGEGGKSAKALNLSSSVVWANFMIIKASQCERVLTENEYLSLPKKTAGLPELSYDREAIYRGFTCYMKFSKEENYYDECDFLLNLHCRLTGLGRRWPGPSFDFLFDEVQDVPVSGLLLMLRISNDPNRSIFSGDTAQAIVRGVSFRFADLSSKLHTIGQQEQGKRNGKNKGNADDDNYLNGDLAGRLSKPEIVPLEINFRSHSGILKLSSVLMKVLQHFFTNTCDRLNPDIVRANSFLYFSFFIFYEIMIVCLFLTKLFKYQKLLIIIIFFNQLNYMYRAYLTDPK